MEFKKKYNVALNNLVVQMKFSDLASKCNSEVTAENDVEGYVVNAKSVLGFFSLDLNKPVTITINNPQDAALIEESLAEENISFEVVA